MTQKTRVALILRSACFIYNNRKMKLLLYCLGFRQGIYTEAEAACLLPLVGPRVSYQGLPKIPGLRPLMHRLADEGGQMQAFCCCSACFASCSVPCCQTHRQGGALNCALSCQELQYCPTASPSNQLDCSFGMLINIQRCFASQTKTDIGLRHVRVSAA